MTRRLESGKHPSLRIDLFLFFLKRKRKFKKKKIQIRLKECHRVAERQKADLSICGRRMMDDRSRRRVRK